MIKKYIFDLKSQFLPKCDITFQGRSLFFTMLLQQIMQLKKIKNWSINIRLYYEIFTIYLKYKYLY